MSLFCEVYIQFTKILMFLILHFRINIYFSGEDAILKMRCQYYMSIVLYALFGKLSISLSYTENEVSILHEHCAVCIVW